MHSKNCGCLSGPGSSFQRLSSVFQTILGVWDVIKYCLKEKKGFSAQMSWRIAGLGNAQGVIFLLVNFQEAY